MSEWIPVPRYVSWALFECGHHRRCYQVMKAGQWASCSMCLQLRVLARDTWITWDGWPEGGSFRIWT